MIKHHIKPVVEFFDDSLDFFDKVYKMEELNQLEIDISKQYKTKFILPRSQTDGKKYKVNVLTQDEIEFLLEYYKKDYELLKDYYTKEQILNEWKSSS